MRSTCPFCKCPCELPVKDEPLKLSNFWSWVKYEQVYTDMLTDSALLVLSAVVWRTMHHNCIRAAETNLKESFTTQNQ